MEIKIPRHGILRSRHGFCVLGMTESLVLYGTTNEHKSVQTEVAQVNIHLISGHLC